MIDLKNKMQDQENIPRWKVRLHDSRFILIAIFISLAYFVLSAAISFVAALITFAFIVAVCLFIGRQNNVIIQNSDDQEILENLRQKVAFRFAETLSDPIFILNQKAIIIYINQAGLKQFTGAKLGDPLAFSLRNPELISAIEEVKSSGNSKTIELHQSGISETWFDISISSLKLQSQKPSCLVLSMRNLTQQKHSEAMRSDFIANASHELRTPLTSLIGFIETIEGSAANDKNSREKFLKIMRSQADRMSNLIDDLLSLSHIELRQNIKPKSKVNLSNLLATVVEGLQNQAKAANVKIITNLPDEPINIRADAAELFEVFENLIDNAIKYGSDGKKINVTLNKNSKDNMFDYSVNIIDYGVGISADHVPRLTERFYRVDAESSRKKKGTGLGLAIVKHILNRHGAVMTITSKENIGTNVEVLINK